MQQLPIAKHQPHKKTSKWVYGVHGKHDQGILLKLSLAGDYMSRPPMKHARCRIYMQVDVDRWNKATPKRALWRSICAYWACD